MEETVIKVCTKQQTGALKCEPLHDAFSRACGELYVHLNAKEGKGLVPSDIRKAIGDPAVQGPMAAAAATLWFDKPLSEVDDDGDEVITLAELTDYNRAKKKWADDEDKVIVELCLEMKREIERLDENIKTLKKQRKGAPVGSAKRAKVKDEIDSAKLQRGIYQDVLDKHKKKARKKLGRYNKMRRLFLYSSSYFDDLSQKIEKKGKQKDDLGGFTPRTSAVEQNKMSTCFLASTVASFCHRHPREAQHLVSWVRSQYYVSLKGMGGISVDAPTDAEIALFDQVTSHKEWMATVYKAVGKRIIEKGGAGGTDVVSAVNRLDANEVPGKVMPSWDDDWFHINLGVPIHLFTGMPVEGSPIWLLTKGGNIWKNFKNDALEIDDPRAGFSQEMTMNELHNRLHKIARKERVATAGIGQGRHLKTDEDGNKIPDDWSRNHAYAILDYKPNTTNRAAGKVELYNPHGKLRTTTLREFHQAFDQIAWST